MSLSTSKAPVVPVLTLAVVCLLAITPFFWRGNPSGHDFEFHMFSWMDVLSQWKLGILYPRWAALAHWGYGEARFLFYPPASWLVGAGLGALLPWKVVPGIYCWLALFLSGLAMYRLAREWVPGKDALFAATLYAVNPYHLLIVYWRSALAELLAATLLPLLLFAVVKLKDPGSRPVLRLGLILAACWLVNAPAAVMIHYSAAGLAAVSALQQHSWRTLWKASLAVAMGAGLASFYLIPTVYETRWVNLGEVLSPGLRPQDNFLFTNIADAEHNQFNRLISTVAAAEIAFLMLAIWRARRFGDRNKDRWMLLACWGGAAALIMTSIANPLWQVLPKLRYVQLPWRWLLCLNAALALVLAMAMRRWTSRTVCAALLLGVVVAAGYRILPPWWDTAADITEMTDAIADRTGYEGTDEYVPAGVDPYELNKDLPLVAPTYHETGKAEVLQWDPTDKQVVVHTDRPGVLNLRLFNYPAWEAMVNGTRVAIQSTETTGQMVIPIGAGRNDIRIHFGRTRDRTIGGVVSLLSLGMFLGIWRRHATSRLSGDLKSG